MTSDSHGTRANPRFSVIVPAFNAATTVRFTVESALSQTETDLEVIVVNDGSTDATAEVVERITDPRVKLVSQPNSGLPAARNTGIARARGAYLGFIDSDDLWLPHYLELAAAALESTADAGFAYTDAYAFDAISGKVRQRTAMGRMRPPIPPPADREAFLLELLKRNFIFSSITVPRAVLEVTGAYDESKRAAEDYELSLRILMRGYRAAWIPGEHALYRLHAGQMSRNPARMGRALLDVYQGLDIDEMPTPAHRELLARRRRESERIARIPMTIASIVPQRLIRALKRGGVGESWHDPAPADVAAAFPNLAGVG